MATPARSTTRRMSSDRRMGCSLRFNHEIHEIHERRAAPGLVAERPADTEQRPSPTLAEVWSSRGSVFVWFVCFVVSLLIGDLLAQCGRAHGIQVTRLGEVFAAVSAFGDA